jgi:hypothetical protein
MTKALHEISLTSGPDYLLIQKDTSTILYYFVGFVNQYEKLSYDHRYVE